MKTLYLFAALSSILVGILSSAFLYIFVPTATTMGHNVVGLVAVSAWFFTLMTIVRIIELASRDIRRTIELNSKKVG